MLLLPHQTKQVATENLTKELDFSAHSSPERRAHPFSFVLMEVHLARKQTPKCLKNKLELISDTAPLARHPMCPERGDEDAQTQVPRDLKLNSKQRMTKCQHQCGSNARIICRHCEAADVKVLQRAIANTGKGEKEWTPTEKHKTNPRVYKSKATNHWKPRRSYNTTSPWEDNIPQIVDCSSEIRGRKKRRCFECLRKTISLKSNSQWKLSFRMMQEN